MAPQANTRSARIDHLPPFIVTRDVIDGDTVDDARDEFPDHWPPARVRAEYPVRFRLWDDDGELYYEGRARSVDAVESAHDWGAGYAGTTTSAYRVGTAKEQPFIGYAAGPAKEGA